MAPMVPTDFSDDKEHRRKLAEAINALIRALEAIDSRLRALEP